MMCYSVMTQAYSEKEIPSSPNRSRTYNSKRKMFLTARFGNFTTHSLKFPPKFQQIPNNQQNEF